MADDQDEGFRRELRLMLRRARFHGFSADDLEEEILALFRRGVSTQPPPPADQLPVPPPGDAGGGSG